MKKDCPISDVLEVFSHQYDFGLTTEEVTFESKKEKGTAKDQGILATKSHHTVIAPMVKPVLVEHTIHSVLNGIPIMGIIDVIDASDIVRDNKLRKNKPSQATVDNDIQFSLYARLFRNHFGKKEKGLAMDVTIKDREIKTKGRGMSPLPFVTKRNNAQMEVLDQTVERVDSSIKAGLFPPNPMGWWCSAKFCNFHSMCMGARGKKNVA